MESEGRPEVAIKEKGLRFRYPVVLGTFAFFIISLFLFLSYQKIEFAKGSIFGVRHQGPLPETVSIDRGDGITLTLRFQQLQVHTYVVDEGSQVVTHPGRFQVTMEGSGNMWRFPWTTGDVVQARKSEALARHYVEHEMGLTVHSVMDLIKDSRSPAP